MGSPQQNWPAGSFHCGVLRGPEATTGQIVQVNQRDSGFDVVIEWDVLLRLFGLQAKPLRDWLSKDQYEYYLVEE